MQLFNIFCNIFEAATFLPLGLNYRLMYTKPQPRINHTLTSSELVILKSFALGLGCDTIRQLLEISPKDYDKYCKNIFSKLQVSNAYTAVRIAFKNKILKEKEYTLEKVKAFALEFATKNVIRFETVNKEPKENLWDLYDILLDFHTKIESKFVLNKDLE
jgi:DNA-binding CsgD family transcriptional regulator